MLYYEPYNDIHHMPSTEPNRKAIKSTSTITLFATDGNGDLQVAATQEDYKKRRLPQFDFSKREIPTRVILKFSMFSSSYVLSMYEVITIA